MVCSIHGAFFSNSPQMTRALFTSALLCNWVFSSQKLLFRNWWFMIWTEVHFFLIWGSVISLSTRPYLVHGLCSYIYPLMHHSAPRSMQRMTNARWCRSHDYASWWMHYSCSLEWIHLLEPWFHKLCLTFPSFNVVVCLFCLLNMQIVHQACTPCYWHITYSFLLITVKSWSNHNFTWWLLLEAEGNCSIEFWKGWLKCYWLCSFMILSC